jgi:hypothetical protein
MYLGCKGDCDALKLQLLQTVYLALAGAVFPTPYNPWLGINPRLRSPTRKFHQTLQKLHQTHPSSSPPSKNTS